MTMQLAFEAVSLDAVRLSLCERWHRVADPHVDQLRRHRAPTLASTSRIDDLMTAALMAGVTVMGALMVAAVLAVAPAPAVPDAVVLAVTAARLHP